jgi:S1-C subfamily serine protease
VAGRCSTWKEGHRHQHGDSIAVALQCRHRVFVPSNTVRAYLPSLMSGKSILRGFLGINYVRIDREVAREFGVSDGIQIGAMALGPDNKPMGPASAAGCNPATSSPP